MTSDVRRTARRLIGAMIVLAALVWTAFLLREGLSHLGETALKVNFLGALAAFMLLGASLMISLPTFWWMVRASGAQPPAVLEFARLHYLSQVMKHLPGRFFGVAYQIAVARHVATARQWIIANVAFMGATLWMSVLLPLLILTIFGVIGPAVGVLASLLTLVAPLVGLSLARLAFNCAGERLPRGLIVLMNGFLLLCRRREILRGLRWLILSWIVYIAAWGSFGWSIPGVGFLGGIELCALYSIAWVVGFLSLITPSGLGMRELAFSLLAADHPPDLVLMVAIAGRAAMLSADLMIGLIFFCWGPREKSD